jgi:hypothetical protein
LEKLAADKLGEQSKQAEEGKGGEEEMLAPLDPVMLQRLVNNVFSNNNGTPGDGDGGCGVEMETDAGEAGRSQQTTIEVGGLLYLSNSKKERLNCLNSSKREFSHASSLKQH